MAYRLILEPERYDVVVAPNLYGDILSDAGAAMVGGLGIVGSANCGERFCLAEPVHGSAPDIAGPGTANPIAAISAAVLLLERVGLADEAGRVEEALAEYRENGPRTPDRGGRRDDGGGDRRPAGPDLTRGRPLYRWNQNGFRCSFSAGDLVSSRGRRRCRPPTMT